MLDRSNLYSIVAIATIFSFVFGCLWSDEDVKMTSTGNPGDIVVVMDSAAWALEPGTEMRKCLSAPQEGLPQSEPLFNLIEVTPRAFTNIFKNIRNVVVVEKAANAKQSSYVIKKDVWASNQLVLLIKATSYEDAAKIIKKSCEGIRSKFQDEEWKRLQYAYDKLKDVEVMKKVKAASGADPIIPNDYVVAKEGENFIWLRKDFEHQGHQVSMGFIAYRTPYDSVGMFEKVNIMAGRNHITRMVEGPVEGSYMSFYEEYDPVEREIGFEKKYVKEFRGLWNMKGAFMGGPFVHYTFVDEEGKYLLHLDGYVFAPKFDKREYLRELEAMALSAAK